MALSIDTGTVTDVLSTSSTVNTSASFTAPANSRLVVCVTTNAPTAIEASTQSCTGGSLTWTRRALKSKDNNSGQAGTSAEIWEAWNASSQSMTVSVTPNASAGTTNWEVRTKVCICTGDEGATFTGAITTTSNGSGLASASVTTAANSLLLAAVGDWAHSNPPTVDSFTGGTGTTVITFAEDIQYLSGFFISTSPTSAGTSTLSTTAPSAQNYNMAMIEIKAASGGGGGGNTATVAWLKA